MQDFLVPMTIANVSRSLVAAGYMITDFRRYGGGFEYDCERQDRFGAHVKYRFRFVETDPAPIGPIADPADRTLVVIAKEGGSGQLSWTHFAASIGGAVPSWRALTDDYGEALRTASTDTAPSGWKGEGWAAFEVAVADGLSFIFGRSVKSLGGTTRGQAVPDLLALTPDQRLLVGDAKATKSGVYLVERPKLRAMTEYVALQRARQRGDMPVAGALIIAGEFHKEANRDRAICDEFFATTQVPLALVSVDALLQMVNAVRQAPHIRERVRWGRVFCVNGRVDLGVFKREISGVDAESWSSEL